MRFEGFPKKLKFTPLPQNFITEILRKIEDITELKALLYFFHLLYKKKGYPRFVSLSELENISGEGREKLKEGMDKASSKKIVLPLLVERNGREEEIYFLNWDKDREAFLKVKSGEIDIGGRIGEPSPKRPDIFTLYEENIGVITPIIAEEIKEALKIYPEEWVEEAIREAVRRNKRRWSYIKGVLERKG